MPIPGISYANRNAGIIEIYGSQTTGIAVMLGFIELKNLVKLAPKK